MAARSRTTRARPMTAPVTTPVGAPQFSLTGAGPCGGRPVQGAEWPGPNSSAAPRRIMSKFGGERNSLVADPGNGVPLERPMGA